MFNYQSISIARLLITITAVSLLISWSSTQGQETQDSTAAHIMGKKLEVYNYPLTQPVLKKIAVHTYPVAIGNDGKHRAWKALGGDSGGEPLADTTTKCDKDCVDISNVNYVMSESPCIWPYDPYYAVVGVCWNATNRGLYHTGKTVHKVKFYAVIESYFGTYGLDTNSTCFRKKCREGRRLYAWSKCMKSSQDNYPWQGRSLNWLMDKAGEVDPRVHLFERYFGKQAEQTLSASAANIRQAQYLTDLFDLNIEEKLGKDFSQGKRDQLQSIRMQMEETLKSLQAPEDNHDLYLEQMNKGINAALNQYAEILSDEEYFRFLNATKDEVFDIRIRQAAR
ncbi:hypothetical protein [Sulfuriflexus mobilis]|uniref:hypothetical protein n=1 Tax=Sulfuriflexus mobilis TaxID=1811807 RepID=UPI000F819074|nr:hypothetical protein [Sulfuriflexus mobilis]